ncbi:MAG: lactate racemase domain-containing protein [Candidatus Micrarchaeia archaeon]
MQAHRPNSNSNRKMNARKPSFPHATNDMWNKRRITLDYGAGKGNELELLVPGHAVMIKSRGFKDKPTIENPPAVIEEELRIQLFPKNSLVPRSLLVLIPDNTRPPTSARAGLHALLSILADPELRPEKTTILAGGGTHKPMSEQELREFLGAELFERLKACAKEYNITIGKDGLPIMQHDWKDENSLKKFNTSFEGRNVVMSANKLLFEHEALLNIADVDLHPYMGASGSIYKMCIVGVGGPENIYLTHSPSLLLDEATYPGRITGNRFFNAVKEAALSLFEAMRREGMLRYEPLSVNLVCEHGEKTRVVDVLVGPAAQKWEESADIVFTSYTGMIDRGVHIIIGGVDKGKDQALDQGARLIDFFIRLHDPHGNPILLGETLHRVAILFTPCSKAEYSGGIATPSSFKHLEKLREIVNANIDQINSEISRMSDAREAQAKIHDFKQRVLDSWEAYLNQVYEAERGFGGGGQRALRMLYIMRNFGLFIVGTPNRKVVDYLAQISPPVKLHPEAQRSFEQARVDPLLLGVKGVLLRNGRKNEDAMSAVDVAVRYFEWARGGDPIEPEIVIVPNMHILPKRAHR